MGTPQRDYVKVAVAFATALIEKDFALAESLLAPELRQRLTKAELRKRLDGMFCRYGYDDEPQRIDFDERQCMDEWPSKRPTDAGWAYVGILGEEFVEAVTVVIANVDGELLIRDIEWGRP
jgi:hypothetical protein